MGLVYAEIELINAGDIEMARRHIIGEEEIKSIHISMLVDSGDYMMAINEDIQSQLDLPFVEKRKAVLADGSIVEYDVVGPVKVKFKNRTAVCNAFLLQGSNEPRPLQSNIKFISLIVSILSAILFGFLGNFSYF